jgi:hypothetical protein
MRNFQGSNDQSAVIIEEVFPDSDLVFSTPIEFSNQCSGVYIEGSAEHVEIVFQHLIKLFKTYIDGRLIGSWIALTPPEDNLPRTILHYKAENDLEKIKLLNFILREQLVNVCGLCLSTISLLRVKIAGQEIQRSFIALPKNFSNGKILLPKLKKEMEFHKANLQ